MKNLKILFICGLIPESEEIKNNTKSFMQGAAQSFQLKLIDSLRKNNCDVDVLSAPFIGSWPQTYKKMFFRYRNDGDDLNKYVAFNNIWGIRNFSRFKALKKELKNIKSEEYDYALIYSPHTPFVKMAKLLNNKNIKTVLVVPDLPEYMNLNKKISFVYKLFKKFDIKIFNKNLKYLDGFVFLTQHMSKTVNLYDKPEIVVEGICDNINEYKKIKEKIILYSGTLNEKFGVVDLVQAFKLLPKSLEAQLFICGDGDSKDYIVNESKINKDINYLGVLTLNEVKQMQQKAFVLVNPRRNNEEYTKYSFPSKTMEYLATGRPVICYKLDGIPDEYDDVLQYVEDGDESMLADKLQQVLSFTDEELLAIYNKEKGLLQTKTTSFTGKRLVSFLKEIK